MAQKTYDNSNAQNLLCPYALKALGVVVDVFYKSTGIPREFLPSSSLSQPVSPPKAKILNWATNHLIARRFMPRSCKFKVVIDEEEGEKLGEGKKR